MYQSPERVHPGCACEGNLEQVGRLLILFIFKQSYASRPRGEKSSHMFSRYTYLK